MSPWSSFRPLRAAGAARGRTAPGARGAVRLGRFLIALGAVLIVLGCWAVVGRAIDRLVGSARPAPVRAVAVLAANEIRVRVDGRLETVRLVGTIAPGASATARRSCAGRRARAYVARLVFAAPSDRDGDGLADGGRAPRALSLPSDRAAGDRDSQGRILRYVFVAGARRSLQERVVAAGYARLGTRPGLERRDELRVAAGRARARRRGLYRLCGGAFTSAARR
jgi:hypothetical protein